MPCWQKAQRLEVFLPTHLAAAGSLFVLSQPCGKPTLCVPLRQGELFSPSRVGLAQILGRRLMPNARTAKALNATTRRDVPKRDGFGTTLPAPKVGRRWSYSPTALTRLGARRSTSSSSAIGRASGSSFKSTVSSFAAPQEPITHRYNRRWSFGAPLASVDALYSTPLGLGNEVLPVARSGKDSRGLNELLEAPKGRVDVFERVRHDFHAIERFSATIAIVHEAPLRKEKTPGNGRLVYLLAAR